MISNEHTEQQKELDILPISPSKYEEITENIEKININGHKILTLLHQKAIVPRMENHISLLKEMQERMKFIKKELNKISKIPDRYRKAKAIDKLKNDFFFRVNDLFDKQLQQTTLPQLKDQLTESLDWYINRLQKDILKYPKKLAITYPASDFQTQKTDSFSLQLLKRTKQFTSVFTPYKTISQTLDFKKIARHFQLNSRLVFLSNLLEKLEEEEIPYYSSLRKNTTFIISQLENIDLETLSEKDDIYDQALENSINNLDELIATQQEKSEKMLSRLKVEFHKNLELMQSHMELIGANSQLAKYKKNKKYRHSILKKIQDFPNDEHLTVKTLLNKIVMELAVNAARTRLKHLQKAFHDDIQSDIHNKYLKQLDKNTSLIEAGEKEDIENLTIKLSDDFESSLHKYVDENKERMQEIMLKLPETLQIYRKENDELTEERQEKLNIPIARMGEYYLKSRYEVSTEDKIDQLISQTKRSYYDTKDALHLLQFEEENKRNHALEKEYALKLKAEKQKIQAFIEEFKEISNTQLSEVFVPLSPEKVEESAHEFTSGLISYQREQVLSGVNRFTHQIQQFFQSKITQLLYERDKSIFFKKNKKSKGINESYTSQLLQLEELVSPNEQVTKKLPPYYVSLFSGKSSNNKDFWVKRPKEEATFQKAITRYKAGYHGGILVIGDRNEGKTSFCKYATKHFLKGHNHIDVFPSIHGNASIESFTLALKKATGIREKANVILSQLPKNTALTIHDLELYWEKSEDGMDVISYLCELIDQFSHKIIFIVNLNPYAHKLISQLETFNDRFIENIALQPFYAESLNEIILKRHKSSGIFLAFEDKEDDKLNELQLAKLFNSYSDYSKGNVGTALNGWITNIKEVSKNKIIIQKPVSPSLAPFQELREDWVVLLTQLILHKRVSIAKVMRVCNWEAKKAKSMILAFKRVGLIVEKSTGIYQANHYLHPFITKFLNEREIL